MQQHTCSQTFFRFSFIHSYLCCINNKFSLCCLFLLLIYFSVYYMRINVSVLTLSFVLQGSIKKKIESFRRWSSASIKRPPKTKAKTLSLSSPVGDPDDLWLQEGDRRKLRPIVDSVFGQVGL